MAFLHSQVTHSLPHRLFILFISVMLTACGGGGGGTTSQANTDASLSALSLSSTTLSPSFQSAQLSYTGTVSYTVTSVTVNATTTDSNATLKINGVSVGSGVNTAPIAMNVGVNTISVIVTAQDGTTMQTYTLGVTRLAPSTDASLSALSISNGTLSPSFQSTQLSYTDTVSYFVTSVTVNATTTDSNATVKINGVSVGSGANSTPINLAQGSNTINLVVTAQDGVTTQTYSITVTRLPSASLSALSITNVTLDQPFQSSQSSYTSGVHFLINSVRVNAMLTDNGATMTVNGVAASSGVNTTPINLAEGSNTIVIVVTATDGITTQTYSIDITRQTAASFAQQSYSDPDAATNDRFGVSIAISGDTMVVGAEWEDTAPNTDNGAAYVFVRNSGVWSIQQKLIADNAASSDNFGHSVAIAGNTIVVGALYQDGTAFNAGAAYVFIRSNGIWSQQGYLQANDAAANDQFGISVSISVDSIVVGAYQPSGNGAAYVFVRSNGVWSQQQKLTAGNAGTSDLFGKSVAIEGDTLVVGAPQEDGDASSTATTPNDSATDAGAAYVFTRSSTTWTQQAYLKATGATTSASPGDHFGDTVSISGNNIAVGATGRSSGAGAAYVFVGSGASWSQQAFLQASNAQAGDAFGYSIAISEDRLVVGADTEDGDASSTTASPNEGATDSGAVYVFLRDGTNAWTQQLYVKASDAAAGDYFGSSVGIDVDTLVVGARAKSTTGGAYVFQ